MEIFDILLKRYSFLLEEEKEEKDFKQIGNIRKEIGKLTSIVEEINSYNLILETINLLEKEPIEFASDILELKEKKENSLKKIENLLIKMENEQKNKNIFLEIRAGTGGDEASLFVEEIYNMYLKYLQKLNISSEIINISRNDIGIKSIEIYIPSGFLYLFLESGVHRVQRVPLTEKKGRIHTSTITVAILVEDEEIDKNFQLNPKDILIETTTSQGAGGQHVNKTESCVILTHIPTGIKVRNQNERSQHKNKEQAFNLLTLKVKNFYQKEKEKEITDNRKQQIGTGDRNEKIRTYNFPQNRITDHRYNITFFNLEEIMEGNFQKFFDMLVAESKKIKY